MVSLKDILSVLDRWPTWKAIKDAPERVDDLEERIAELEKRLERAPSEACPRCGALEFRVKEVKQPREAPLRMAGVRDHVYECQECEFTDTVRVGLNG